jgi:hypothetical protein
MVRAARIPTSCRDHVSGIFGSSALTERFPESAGNFLPPSIA